MESVKIGTLNSQGGNRKKELIARYFEEHKLDILLLQEIHDIKPEYVAEIEMKTKTKIYKCPGTSNSRGVITMIRESDKVKNSRAILQDAEGNMLEVEVIINGTARNILNLYAPNKVPARKRLFEKVTEATQHQSNKIFGGDLNQTFDISLDCFGKSQRSFDLSRPVTKLVDAIKARNHYCDVYRTLHPHTKEYTFTGIENYRARLDYIFVHQTHMDRVRICGIEACPFSDHDMFWVEISNL